ncbi:MAG: hypothetical protein ABSG41_00990 [Bryobacteraceae bacterium]
MKTSRLSFTVAGALVFAGASLMMASDIDHLTKMTFSQPVEVPGKVLPAGTYMFRLLDAASERNVVEIYNADQTRLEHVVLTIPDERMKASGKTIVQFAETPAGSPEALKAWFYPGDNIGQEFVYPHDRAVQLAKATNQPVYSTRSDVSSYARSHVKSSHDEGATKLKQAPVKVVQPNGEETELPSGQQER